MGIALLESKYRVPVQRPAAVARPRLTERLNAAPGFPLTVLSAPAGFGKTTVLVEWLAGLEAHGTGVAWLSLDQRDNDARLFWTYLATALHSAADVGAEALQLLASSSPSTDAALAALLNDLDRLPTNVLLILDDYHLIEAPEVHEG